MPLRGSKVFSLRVAPFENKKYFKGHKIKKTPKLKLHKYVSLLKLLNFDTPNIILSVLQY